MTASAQLCYQTRVSRVLKGIHRLRHTLIVGTGRCTSTVVPNCARLRHTRPIAVNRRLLTCIRVLSQSTSHLGSYHEHLGISPLNSKTVTNSAVYLSHRKVTIRLNFSTIARGSVSTVTSQSCVVRVLFSLTMIKTRLSHVDRSIVL